MDEYILSSLDQTVQQTPALTCANMVRRISGKELIQVRCDDEAHWVEKRIDPLGNIVAVKYLCDNCAYFILDILREYRKGNNGSQEG